jgi:hypothetical protein
MWASVANEPLKMAIAMNAANATANAGVDAADGAAVVAIATNAVNAMKAQPNATRVPKHARRVKMAATAEVQSAAIAMVKEVSALSAAIAVRVPMPTMQSTLKMSIHKPLIQPNQTSATKLAQKELLAEKADANVAKAAENVAIAVSVATTTILDKITLLKTQRILDLPKVS